MPDDSPGAKFTRCVEDFTCEHCGAQVRGTGYTNHCPRCLWSRHVDISPGDRRATCGGMMKAVGVEYRSDAWVLLHRCLACGVERRNKTSPEDSFEAILDVARNRQQSG